MLDLQTQLKNYQAMRAIGERSIASEYSLVLDDYPDLQFSVKTFPLPVIAPESNIEHYGLGGQKMGTVSMPKTHMQGSFALYETADGKMTDFLNAVAQERTVNERPSLDFTIYQGTQENHTKAFRCYGLQVFGFDPVEIDMESGTQMTILQGQCQYHYFGEEK